MWFPKSDLINLVWNYEPPGYTIIDYTNIRHSSNGIMNRVIFSYDGERYEVSVPSKKTSEEMFSDEPTDYVYVNKAESTPEGAYIHIW